jgi:DNA-binding CsgD family transcriptional regulator
MRMLESRALGVIDRCYAGVLDEAAWQEGLVGLADLVGGTGTLLFAMHPATKTITRFDVARFDRDVVMTYAAEWASRDVRADPAFNAPVGVPQTEETLLPARTLRGSAIYNEFLRPVDAPHLINTLLHRSADRVVTLAIEGTRRCGALTERRDRLTVVLPHLTRAIELKDRLSIKAAVSTSLVEIADRLSLAILIVDGRGRLIETSSVGRHILGTGDGIYCEGDRLAFRRRVDGQAFARFLAIPPQILGPVMLRIPRQRRRACLSLLIAPIRSTTEPWMTAIRQWIVAIHDPTPAETPAPEDVARQWLVTPAEARVVCLLARGSTVQQIADSLSLSVHTVRSQLKAVYAKTGLTSQLEVVRRLLAGDGNAAGL